MVSRSRFITGQVGLLLVLKLQMESSMSSRHLSDLEFARLIRELARKPAKGHKKRRVPLKTWRAAHREELIKLRKRMSNLPQSKVLAELMEVAKVPSTGNFRAWCIHQSPATLKALRTLLRGGMETKEEHNEEPTCDSVSELIARAMANQEIVTGLGVAAHTLRRAESKLRTPEAREAARTAVLAPAALVIGKRQSAEQRAIECLAHGNGEQCCAELGDEEARKQCRKFIEAKAAQIEKTMPQDGNWLYRHSRALTVAGTVLAAVLMAHLGHRYGAPEYVSGLYEKAGQGISDIYERTGTGFSDLWGRAQNWWNPESPNTPRPARSPEERATEREIFRNLRNQGVPPAEAREYAERYGAQDGLKYLPKPKQAERRPNIIAVPNNEWRTTTGGRPVGMWEPHEFRGMSTDEKAQRRTLRTFPPPKNWPAVVNNKNWPAVVNNMNWSA